MGISTPSTEDSDEVSSSSPNNFADDRPWGGLPVRSGRGDIVGRQQAHCSQVELDKALAYIWASWLTGSNEIGWDLWVEDDVPRVGNAIRQCWRLVEEDQRHMGEEPYRLECLVARKV